MYRHRSDRTTSGGNRNKAGSWSRSSGSANCPTKLRNPTVPGDVPFGLQVAQNPPPRLEENPTEREVLFLIMELTIQDGPYSAIADELNRRGYRTRQALKWTPISVFPDVAALDRGRSKDLRHRGMAATPGAAGEARGWITNATAVAPHKQTLTKPFACGSSVFRFCSGKVYPLLAGAGQLGARGVLRLRSPTDTG